MDILSPIWLKIGLVVTLYGNDGTHKLQDNILKNVGRMANNVAQNSHAATLANLKMAIISPFFIRFWQMRALKWSAHRDESNDEEILAPAPLFFKFDILGSFSGPWSKKPWGFLCLEDFGASDRFQWSSKWSMVIIKGVRSDFDEMTQNIPFKAHP